ncbi:MAG TPA: nuclear transport factor 2 family protein, partial [Bryobacteraceae bacterium]
LVSIAAAAEPAAASPKAVMAHHIAAVKQDDVDAVMKDYAGDSVLVTPAATFVGAANIRKFFERLAAEHRDWSTYVVTQVVEADGVVLQKNVKTGKVEVYVVRDGKIAFQTVPP